MNAILPLVKTQKDGLLHDQYTSGSCIAGI
jgi:hypothetical protein